MGPDAMIFVLCMLSFKPTFSLSSFTLMKRLFAAAAAAAAAKSLQSCPTLCNPIDDSPPGSPIPGILQARIMEWVAISFSNAWKWKVKVKLLSHVRLLVTPWTAAYQGPPSMGFSRQEYWSGVPFAFSCSKWQILGKMDRSSLVLLSQSTLKNIWPIVDFQKCQILLFVFTHHNSQG